MIDAEASVMIEEPWQTQGFVAQASEGQNSVGRKAADDDAVQTAVRAKGSP